MEIEDRTTLEGILKMEDGEERSRAASLLLAKNGLKKVGDPPVTEQQLEDFRRWLVDGLSVSRQQGERAALGDIGAAITGVDITEALLSERDVERLSVMTPQQAAIESAKSVQAIVGEMIARRVVTGLLRSFGIDVSPGVDGGEPEPGKKPA